MHEKARNYFKIHGSKIRWTKKTNGVYELRVQIDGQKYYASSVDLKKAKEKMLDQFRIEPKEKTVKETPTVNEYARHYLETYKKPRVCERFFRNYELIVQNHISPKLGEKKITAVTATDLQKLLNEVVESGKGRTSECLKSLLKWIFETAVSDNLIRQNPMRSVWIPKHVREIGKQIPSEDVRKFLSVPPKQPWEYVYRFMLYTGTRPIEIESIDLSENGFVKIRNAKTPKGSAPTYRRIPIHEDLKEYVRFIVGNYSNVSCLRHFRRYFPDYRFYDLRHTFTSRARECGADPVWIDYITGHTSGNTTTRVYTHFSDEYLIENMRKLFY